MKILIVEDEEEIGEGLIKHLKNNSIFSDTSFYFVPTFTRARLLIDTISFSLISLDRILPDGDGLALIPYIRASRLNYNSKILVLTQKVDLDSRIDSFSSSADDYLSKPFLPEEYVARMARLLNYKYVDNGAWLELSPYAKLDITGCRIRIGGTLVKLTQAESHFLHGLYVNGVSSYQLIAKWMGERGGAGVGIDIKSSNTNVVSAKVLSVLAEPTKLEVYESGDSVSSQTNTSITSIKMLVSRLKRKLKERTGYEVIKTVYGVGFGVR